MFLDTNNLNIEFDSRKDKFRQLKVEISVGFLHLKSFVGWS